MARVRLNRRQVLDVAFGLADEVGLEALSMTLLARRLGVAVPSLYEHVRGLPDLLDAVAADAADALADVLSDALQGRSGDAALTAYAGSLRRWASSHPGLYPATMRPLTNPELCRGQQRIGSSCAALLRGYGLAGAAATDAVRCVRSTLHGFITLEATGAFQAARDVDDSWNACMQALARALTTWPHGELR